MKRTMQDERFLPKTSRPVRGSQESLLDSLGGFLFYWCKKRSESGEEELEFADRRSGRVLPQRRVTLRASDGQRLALGAGEREDAGMIDTRSDFDHDKQEFLVRKQRLDIERSVPVPADRPASTSSSVRRITNSRNLHAANEADDPVLRKSTARFSGDSSLRPLPNSFGASSFAAQQSRRGSIEATPQPETLRPSGMRRIHYFYMQLFNDTLDAHPRNREVKKQQLKGILRPVPLPCGQKPAFQPVSKDPFDTRRLRFTQTLIEEKEKLRKKTSMPVRPAVSAHPQARVELPQSIKVKTVAVPQKQKYSFSLEDYLEKDKLAVEPRSHQSLKPPTKVRDPILSFGEGRSKQNSPASSPEVPPTKQPEPLKPLLPEVERQPSKDIQITIPTKEEIVDSEESDHLKGLPKDVPNTVVRLLKSHHVEDAKTPASSPIKPKEKKRLDLAPKNSATVPEGLALPDAPVAAKPEDKDRPAPLSSDAAEKPKPPMAVRTDETPVSLPKQQTQDQPTPAFPSLFSNNKQPSVAVSQPPPDQPTKLLITGQPPTTSLFSNKQQMTDTAKASDVDAKKEVPVTASGPAADPKTSLGQPQQNKLGIDFFTSKPFEKPNAPGFFPSTQPPSPAPQQPTAATKPTPSPPPAPEASQSHPINKETAVQTPTPPQPPTSTTAAAVATQAQPKPSPFFSPLPSTSAQTKPAAPGPQKESQPPAENPFISLTRGSTSTGSSFNNLLKENKLSSLFGAAQQPQPATFFGGSKPDEQRLGRSSMIEEEKIDAAVKPGGWTAGGAGRTFFGSEASNQGSSFFAGGQRSGQAAGYPPTSHNSFTGHQDQPASSSFFNKHTLDSRDASNPYFRDAGAPGRSSFQQPNSSSSFFAAGFANGSREPDRGSAGFGSNGSLFGTSGPNPFTPGASQRQSLFGQDDRRGGAPFLKIKRPSGQDNKNRSLY